MKNSPNNYNNDNYYDVDVIDLEPAGGGLSGMLARRSFDRALREDTMEVLEERHDYMMARNVLEHTWRLSSAEARMSEENPHARERFRIIVDVYTAKAVRRMEER